LNDQALGLASRAFDSFIRVFGLNAQALGQTGQAFELGVRASTWPTERSARLVEPVGIYCG
jgi:hypothetical protein